ncbi:hypothetical protein EV196_101531 [Mariniflexile fucanivorans]|uniref:Uncharacterized protein n=1 Tax=Mariniflexile fucanivorans TaxID=264023 RepID=A0A4R1RS20_9FLAO|nr:hypothetical protein [Mariniflexile fucanivorans]TCL69099.1 hypothetical protein EV196_101531 [Mariniflexile fucanivorans]
MKKDKEDFELVKDPESKKKNYIFQKDGITKKTGVFVIIVLVLLIVAVILSGVFFYFSSIGNH